MSEGLPLKFKLYKDGRHVGYMKWEIALQENSVWKNEMINRFSRSGKNWVDENYWIAHNEQRQFTGFHDRNGQEIYFGDIICSQDYRYKDYRYKVIMDELGGIMGKHMGEPPMIYSAIHFDAMEVEQ